MGKRARISVTARHSCRVHKWRVVRNYKAHHVRRHSHVDVPQEVEQCAYCGVDRVATKGSAE